MFVYKKIDDNWLQKIKEYNFSKPLDDGCPPETHWYINHEENEALYYIGWVSSSILRCEGESLYEFAYIYNEKCMHITAYIFPANSANKWNDRNRLIYNCNKIPELDNQVLNQKVKEAIIFYLNNIEKDRMNRTRIEQKELSDGMLESKFICKVMSKEERQKALEEYSIFDFFHNGFYEDRWVINQNEDIYLIYISCTDGTHAPDDFVETCKFFMNWKGTPLLIRLADSYSYKGVVITYKIYNFEIPDNLKENRKQIIEGLKEALTVYHEMKNPKTTIVFDF